ncbi:hypothetical protein ACJIZ3_007721 [Penstemon smallii]|uniref:F-box domain-containing protein n=1 Tax=Penstemon smallii TaxID=265156 RepID=A0ABD3T7R0_9LAMI
MGCKKANAGIDFMQYLETDLSLYIMSFLHDPSDLVRACSVSHSWHQFVIENGVAKELCLKTLSGCSNILGTVKGDKSDNRLQTDHEVYATLLHAFQNSEVYTATAIEKEISASSTNSPNQRIAQTLIVPDYPLTILKDSHWSSKGQSHADVPETLTYKLRSGVWVMTEIFIQSFQANLAIYSAKSVRFRIEIEWTYTSPEFPMKQDKMPQGFKLPQPVLCLDGYLKIELLGRVQRHQKDALFYICLSYVRARGHKLFPAFDVMIDERYGKPLLMYNPKKLRCVFKRYPGDELYIYIYIYIYIISEVKTYKRRLDCKNLLNRKRNKLKLSKIR